MSDYDNRRIKYLVLMTFTMSIILVDVILLPETLMGFYVRVLAALVFFYCLVASMILSIRREFKLRKDREK